MPTPMQQHPSAMISRGTTLVPETVDVVSAFLRRTPVPEEDIGKLLRDVHSTLIGIAVESGSAGPDLHRIGYQPAPGTSVDVRAALPGILERLSLAPSPLPPRPLPAPLPEPRTPPAALPLPEPARAEVIPEVPARAPSSNVVQLRDARAERRPKAPAPEQVELPISPTSPVPPKGVTIRTSVEERHIICLEDGRKTTNLAQHLADRHGMTPEAYRRKWGLPDAYPMVPPSVIRNRGDQYEFEPLSGTFRRIRK